MKPDQEIALVNAFVVRNKRRRYVGFLGSPKRREKFLRRLYHFNEFDPAFVVGLSGATDSSDGLLAELRRRGAGKECYVISVCEKLDGTTRPLAQAIDEVFAFLEGTSRSMYGGRC